MSQSSPALEKMLISSTFSSKPRGVYSTARKPTNATALTRHSWFDRSGTSHSGPTGNGGAEDRAHTRRNGPSAGKMTVAPRNRMRVPYGFESDGGQRGKRILRAGRRQGSASA